MFQEFEENDKSEDFLADFRNKINQDNQASFQEKKEEINRSKNILVGAVSGIVLAAVVGFVAFSPKYQDNVSKELPVVRRPQKAVKVQPMDPGGMQIANQDKSVYDIIEKKVEDTTKNVESILPPPEEIKAPVLANEKTSVEDIIKEAEAPAVAPVVETKVVEKVEVAKDIIEKTSQPQKVVEPKPAPKPVVKAEPKPVAKVEAKPAPKPAPKVEATKAPTSAVAVGMWQVQIMSSQNQKAIEASKSSLVKKHAVLKNVEMEVEQAIIAGKGTFYRLKAGAYKTRAEADKLCAELKKAGVSCFVKKK